MVRGEQPCGEDHSDDIHIEHHHQRRGGPQPAELMLPPDALLSAAADQLVEQAKATGVALTDEGGLLTGFVQKVLQGALELRSPTILATSGMRSRAAVGELAANGHYPKTVRTEVGDVALKIPRDRNGSFEPVTVPVGQRRLSGLDQMVISLYAKGLTTGDIASYLEDVYDQRVDPGHDLADHRRHRRRHGGLAVPATRQHLPGAVGRRDPDQDPRRLGHQPGRLRGHGHLAVDPIHVRHDGLLEDWGCDPPSPQGARWNCTVMLA